MSGSRQGSPLVAASPVDYLNLSRNALTKAGAKAITATGVKADVSRQHGEVPGQVGEGDTPEYLFEGDIE